MNGLKLKPAGIFFVLFITATVLFCASTNDSTGSKNKYYILDNGLEIYLENRDNIPLVNIAFAIDVGSKDEDAKTNGMVHILEHLILLGETEYRTSDEINQAMRRRGAAFNAHTGHDMMTFELSLPARFWQFGLDILKEKLFQLKFSGEKLAKEKEIIFKEIAQIEDKPLTLGTLLVLQNLFSGHPYERPIAGSKKVVENTSIEELKTFYNRYFVPANCSLVVVGKISVDDVDRKIRRVFGKLEKKENPRREFKEALPPGINITVNKEMDINQPHLIIGFYAPPTHHPDRLAVDFLEVILGDGIDPLLGRMLVQRGKRLAYNIWTRYITLEYGGAFLIYLTLESTKTKITAARKEVINFLKSSWSVNYSKKDFPPGQQSGVTDYLETAKNTIKISYQQFRELGLNAATFYAGYILFHKNHGSASGYGSSGASFMERVTKMKAADLRSAASRYFSGKHYVTVAIVPLPVPEAGKK